jgi:hypothetical protein
MGGFDKIPPLKEGDGSSTNGGAEQAEVLLSTFFPSLPDIIEEGLRPQRTPLPMPSLTMEEVEQRVFAAKS